MKKLVIIPAYNEEKTIINTCQSVKKHTGFDYIVVNDGSTDGTERILCENDIPHITLIKNLGIGGAVQTGYKYADQQGYDIAVQIDADGQHNPAYLDIITDALVENKADMVIGSRYIEKEGFQSSHARRFGKNIITIIIKLLTGTKITDPTSGFRAISKNVIKLFASSYPVDYPEPESVVELLARKLTVIEVPVVMNKRGGGTTSITLKKSIYYMIKVNIAILFSYINNVKKGGRI